MEHPNPTRQRTYSKQPPATTHLPKIVPHMIMHVSKSAQAIMHPRNIKYKRNNTPKPKAKAAASARRPGIKAERRAGIKAKGLALVDEDYVRGFQSGGDGRFDNPRISATICANHLGGLIKFGLCGTTFQGYQLPIRL